MPRRVAFALLLALPLLAAKRPLTPADFDSWRHIQNQQLSNNGRYLAYALFPQQGDGELIVRDLTTNTETHAPIGELPPPPPPNFAAPQPEDAPPPSVGIAVKFSADSSALVFTTFAPRAEVEKAKREKRKPEDMPKGDLVIISLPSAAVFRAPRVKTFQLPSTGGGFVVYLQLPEPVRRTEPPAKTETNAKLAAKKTETGDLILRNLSDGSERKFHSVSEYLFARDAKTLLYTVDGAGDASGVYALNPAAGEAPMPLLAGKGKYSKLTFDEDQTRLAFLCDRSVNPQITAPNLYTWDRVSSSAVPHQFDLAPGFVISDRASLVVSKGGNKIFFGVAPDRLAEKPVDDTPPDERVSVDLWSWKDDHIQPMQKVRAAVERSRSYRAVFDIAANKYRQLADASMNEIAPSDDGSYAIGIDDRAYRRMQEYDAAYEDSYIVNVSTGERTMAVAKHTGHLMWSPDSKYTVFFNGKDWISVAVPSGRQVNLTAKLAVSFAREDFDSPGVAPSYGLAGWTADGKALLFYDRFDVWQSAPDGTSARNLTQSLGRNGHVAFRVVRFERDDPSARWIDPTKPLYLRAENEDTRETGFYRTSVNSSAAPQKLVMAAKNFAVPIQARDADVFITAASTFNDYPDLLITDSMFRSFRKVTNANPQLAGLLWGTSELIHFQSVDGKPLTGTLYKPENFDPRNKYPLLVYIYERLSQDVNNFIEPRPQHTLNASYYVSNGYLVLEPDIAYRIGYPGQSALDCVLPAVQSVVDKGYVDEHAIGIQGHSWGGYQIAYMVTRTNRFRAAAAGAPVADMISAYDSIRWGPGIPRQFQYERTQSRIGGSLWEYPLRFIENSPIFAVDRITTPLLLLHNDADDAVPWYQGIELFLAMRRLNKEAYMFTYNGEPHGIRRRANQKDYAERMQQFFDYYLKGAEKPSWMEHGIPFIEKQGAAATDDDAPQ